MAADIERTRRSLDRMPDTEPGITPGAAPGMDDQERRRTLVLAGLAILVGLLSFFVLGSIFSNPETFRSTIAALDEKRDVVMNLVGASTGSSAAISLLPGDAGTPIAEKLVDLSSDFLVVIAAIYLEKYLLTVLGFVSFRVLVPVACALAVIVLTLRLRPAIRASLAQLSVRLFVFAVAIVCVVPASVFVSGMIERTYEESISATIASAEQTTGAIENSADAQEDAEASNPLAFLLNAPEELSKLTDAARSSLNNFIETLAVMIVTSCVIPILVLVFFLWLVRLVLGIELDLPGLAGRTRALRGPRRR